MMCLTCSSKLPCKASERSVRLRSVGCRIRSDPHGARARAVFRESTISRITNGVYVLLPVMPHGYCHGYYEPMKLFYIRMVIHPRLPATGVSFINIQPAVLFTPWCSSSITSKSSARFRRAIGGGAIPTVRSLRLPRCVSTGPVVVRLAERANVSCPWLRFEREG